MTTLNVSAGNTRLTATPVSFGSGSLQVGGNLVNVTSGADDFYQLRLNRSSANFNLQSLTAGTNVDFQLLDSTGNTIIQQSGNTGNVTDRINVADLATGTYYLRVFTSSTSPASYSLNLTGRTNERFDLIWRNYGTPGVNGTTSLWTMVGVNPVATVNMPFNVTNPAWEIVGSGDFNKDGIADLVWRNHETTGPEAGIVAIWTMNANNNPTGTVQMPLRVANPNWRIEGVGDFNQDGQPDLVWRNYETTGLEAGLVVIWTMNGVNPVGTTQMPLRIPNRSWCIDGVGDFNNDGQADLVWRNYETTGPEAGLVVIWTMNGVNPVGTTQMPLRIPNPNWRIDGVGDFNGDGQSDLVWRNYETTGPEAGLVVIWTMNGVNPVGTTQMPLRVTDPKWRINGTRSRYDMAPSIDVDANSFATAFNIGTLNGMGTFIDSLNSADTSDFYQFSLTSGGTANLLLNGLSADANLYLYNSSGTLIQSATTAGNASESLSRSLAAGTYRVEVRAINNSTTNYNLVLSNIEIQLAPDLFGASFDVVTEPSAAGNSITANFQVRNGGNGNAGAFRIGFYLSSDNTISTADRLLGSVNINSLTANTTTSTQSISLTLPGIGDSFWSGVRSYRIGMVIDSLGAISEINEGNNANLGDGVDFDDVSINPLPTVSLTVSDASAAEPGNPGQFTISRTGSTATSLTVSYTVTGTASNGSDYSALSGTIVIPVGQASVILPVTVLDDALVEGDETVTVTLAANNAYTLGSTPSGTVIIADNDANSFNIQFDYRFDTIGWFTPARRAALEAAAAVWEQIILDEFADIPTGTATPFVRDPQTGAYVGTNDVFVTDTPIDDLLIFVGARDLGSGTLGLGGASGFYTNETRYTGADYEPWIGSITFNNTTSWFFDTTPSTSDDIPFNTADFISVAVHEIGHVLGFSSGTNAYTQLRSGDFFTGANARARNGGNAIPLEPGSVSHILEDYEFGNTGESAMDPTILFGRRKLPTVLDIAILDDIGYTVNYGAASQNLSSNTVSSQPSVGYGRCGCASCLTSDGLNLVGSSSLAMAAGIG